MLVAMHAFFSSFRKERCCGLKQEPVKAGIGKWFCTRENEGDGKSPTGIFHLGKLFSQ
jgi:L,D-peptidoglycan transpeptidase YkuD (ErfK/YbiS/YcfS/YnhG family)